MRCAFFEPVRLRFMITYRFDWEKVNAESSIFDQVNKLIVERRSGPTD